MLRPCYRYAPDVRDKVVRHEVATLRGSERFLAVSPVALEIYVRAIDRSVHTRRPAFVPDTTLDALAPGHVTTIAALELCLAGLWHRAMDGYVVSDLDLVERLSAGAVRRTGLRWMHRVKTLIVRCWHAVNRDNFIPF
jgi:hypothetical protein